MDEEIHKIIFIPLWKKRLDRNKIISFNISTREHSSRIHFHINYSDVSSLAGFSGKRIALNLPAFGSFFSIDLFIRDIIHSLKNNRIIGFGLAV